MQFRWVIGIALWTILSGPIFAPPQAKLRSVRAQAEAKQPAPVLPRITATVAVADPHR